MRARVGSPRLAERAVFAAIVLLCGFAMAASAGPVAVRSGEHPGFSRLVIDFGQVPQWTVNEREGGRRLDFAGQAVALDVSGVFARMGRSRIASVDAGPGHLDLTLTCDCAVTVFELAGGRLVIDVSEQAGTGTRRVASEPEAVFVRPRVLGETLETTPLAGIDIAAPHDAFVAPRAPAEPGPFAPKPVVSGRPALLAASMPRAAVPGPVLLAVDPPATAAAGSPQAAEAVAGSLPPHRGEGFAGTRHGPSPWLFATLSAQDRQTAATEAMSEALERAARQGLIDLPETDSGREDGSPPTLTQPGREGSRLPLPLGEEQTLRVTTSLDRDLDAIARRLRDSTGSGCLRGYDVDVASWGDHDAPLTGLSGLRGDLLGEFDTPDVDVVTGLARHYLFLGFGAEARAVTEAFALPEGETSVLTFLADIADGVLRPPDDEAALLLGCPGPAAMWGLLAIAEPQDPSLIAKTEVMRAFSGLPLHLRRHYGPVLVDRFLAIGDPDSARTIWSAVDRASGRPTEEFVLATADLARAEGDIAAAETGYGALEAANPGNAPRAVLQLLKSRLERGAPVDPGLVETAAVLGFENRGTALARDLKRAELRGRIALDDWSRVFSELPAARFDGMLTAEDAVKILSELYVAMAARADLSIFLERGAEAGRRLTRSPETDPARRALAARYLDLGLAAEAEALLADISETAGEDTLLATRIDILLGRHAAAAERLQSVQSPEALRLRAEALSAMGRFAEAAEALLVAGDPAAAGTVAARGGLWDRAGQPLQSAAVSLLMEQSDPDGATPLARNRSLIEGAGALREDIATLLSAADTARREN